MPETRKWWIIRVSGYGSFAGYGREAEVEKVRAAKAEWEGGTGMKRIASERDEDDARIIESQKDIWRTDLAGGVELDECQREAIGEKDLT